MMSPASQKPSILIVEDERIVAKDLQQTLFDMGYDPFAVASSAEEAIARVSERCPDLVLMDIRIKGPRDGIETAEILKRGFDLPVVYLTAHADAATIERAKITQPHGYLVKPVKAAELNSCIEVSLFKHKMEKRARERERWFSATLRSITDAVVTVDIGGKVTFLNPAAEALIGLPAGEIVGKPASEVLRLVDQRSVEAGETPLDMALRVMQPIQLHEASLLNLPTGAQRSIDDNVAPAFDENLALGAVMVFRDVTQEKLLHKRLELADRLSSLGTMAAGTAHELTKPLGVVIASAGLVAGDLDRHRKDLRAGISLPLAERRLNEIAGALGDLQSAASRMASIISDLRAFSRPAQATPGLADLARCVEWAVRAIPHEFDDRARLLTRFGDVPLVQGDETRLRQVIINFLVNAAQAIPPGNADLHEVSVTTYTDDHGRAVAEVRDTGSGIPPDVLPRIFEPFFTTKEEGKSAGLGLSICHGIVSSFGGEITVGSQVGRGTTVRVLLPPAPAATAEAAPGDRQETQRLRGRILVVDDEEVLSHIIGRALEKEAHEVVCIENASEALELIEQGEKFDVIFCNLTLPNMTGMQFYEALLSQNPDLARRMVFLSGGITTAGADDFLRSVPNMLVEKPFTPKRILEAVQQLLEAQQLHRKNLELEQANTAKEFFMSSMSHELRTPLNAIIGYTGTLLMKLAGPLTPDQEKQLKTVQASGKHLLSLVNDLLDLAKLRSGKVEVQLQMTSCQDLLAEVVSALKPLAEAKSIEFGSSFPEHPVVVRTDPRSLKQILLNLGGNAIKFTAKGSVRLELTASPGADPPMASVHIVDTGMGIKLEDQGRLFQVFERMNPESAVEGTGLGLHLCEKLADLIGGRIEFESEFGRGSRFTLLLPMS